MDTPAPGKYNVTAEIGLDAPAFTFGVKSNEKRNLLC